MGNSMKKIIIKNPESKNADADKRRLTASFLTAEQWKLVPGYNALVSVAPPPHALSTGFPNDTTSGGRGGRQVLLKHGSRQDEYLFTRCIQLRGEGNVG